MSLISSCPGSLKAEYRHAAATITADLDLGVTALNASRTGNNDLKMYFLTIKTLISSCPGGLKAEYKHYAAMLTTDLDLGLTALNSSAVIGHKGLLAGYETSFDLAKFVFFMTYFPDCCSRSYGFVVVFYC